MFKSKVWVPFSQYMLYAGVSTIVFFLVMIIPFSYGIFLTFTNSTGLSTDFQFAGLTNYVAVFKDSAFWDSLGITIKYVLFVVLISNTVAFFIAYLLTSGMRFQNFFRSGFFTPNLLGGIILGFVWRFLFTNVLVSFGKTYEIGIFSKSWLGNPNGAFWTMVIVTVWQLSGYLMIIYVAGFTNVPKSVIEAGQIDGAKGFQKIFNIILPLMINSFTISVFLSLQRAFMVYDLNLSLTSGGPFNSTRMVSMYVYNKAFLSQEYGVGQAQAFVLFIIVSVITTIQVLYSKSKEVEA